MSKRFFGCHVSSSGGLVNSVRAGKALGINTIQIHPSPPQRWNYQAFAQGIENDFLSEQPRSGVEKVFFHAIYLINLATIKPEQLQSSVTSLTHYLDLNARIQGAGVIVHVGSMKDQPDANVGNQQAADAIDRILEKSPDNSRLLLEVSAGSGAIIGAKLEELADIYRLVNTKERLGFALDTQHMWASGYNWQTDLPTIISQLEEQFGFDKIGAIHLNDSKTEFASRKDRHENLGDGLIGHQALSNVVRHPKLANIPLILETPCMKDPETAALDVAKLRAMVA